MKLSAPIFQLKRRAKLLARSEGLPLHEALDRIAREEGYTRWSLLSARLPAGPAPSEMLSRLNDGDLLLIGGRPGQGKTRLGLRILLDAVRAGRNAALFTLEFTEAQARRHFLSLDKEADRHAERLTVDTSDAICAGHIIGRLSGAPRGTVALIDYLQILDQQRSKPPLSLQLEALGTFAKQTGVVLAFVSQIDRSFDPALKPLPDIRDIRLPNLVDLTIFDKACFLHDDDIRLQDVA